MKKKLYLIIRIHIYITSYHTITRSHITSHHIKLNHIKTYHVTAYHIQSHTFHITSNM